MYTVIMVVFVAAYLYYLFLYVTIDEPHRKSHAGIWCVIILIILESAIINDNIREYNDTLIDKIEIVAGNCAEQSFNGEYYD